MHYLQVNTLFNSRMETESVYSWRRKDRNIVQIGDDNEGSLEER